MNIGCTLAATSPTVHAKAGTPPNLTVSTTTAARGRSGDDDAHQRLRRRTDWLALAPVGSPATIYIQFIYVGAGVTTRTWTITMPTTPGLL